jgi:hypothetical protein
MRSINSAVARMIDAVESTFFDSCTIDVFTESIADSGDLIKSYVSGSVIPCGVSVKGGSRKVDGTLVIFDNQMNVRVGLDRVVRNTDKITIKTRNGVSVNAVQYEILNIVIGVTCQIISLKNVSV